MLEPAQLIVSMDLQSTPHDARYPKIMGTRAICFGTLEVQEAGLTSLKSYTLLDQARTRNISGNFLGYFAEAGSGLLRT